MMHLKSSRSPGNGAYAQKGTTLRVMVSSGSICTEGDYFKGDGVQ
jgi:hypothetical protein